jgi:hypothetical protein
MDQHQYNRNRAEDFILHTIGLLTVIPLAPLLNRVVPPIMIGSFNADLLLAILFAYGFVRFILWIFKPLVVPAFVMVCLIMVFNSFTQTYNLRSMVSDYRNLVRQSWQDRDKKRKDLYLVKGSLFDTEVDMAVKGMRDKINHRDSVVRNWAVKHSLDHFDDHYRKYGYYVRFLSLFRHVNSQFKYVPDAERDEYYATPRETIESGMGGDCDDHTILMISAMHAIGARCRMVLSTDHVYPELNCGDRQSFLKIQSAITELFADESFRGLYYREENGIYWINLDYSASHPGGPYINNKAYAVVEF